MSVAEMDVMTISPRKPFGAPGDDGSRRSSREEEEEEVRRGVVMAMMTMMTMITMIPGEKKGAGRGGGRRAGRGRGQVGRRWLGGHQPQTRYNVYSD